MHATSHANALRTSHRARAARLLAGALLALLPAACDDSDPPDGAPDAAPAPTPDAAPAPTPDAAPAPGVRVDVTAEFDVARMELPEGLALADGVAYVGLAFTGEILRIDLEIGARESFGRVAMPPPANDMPAATLTGLAIDGEGTLYATLDVSVPSDIPEAPQTGIYRIDAAGGDAELFAVHDDMRFPNGIYVEGDSLFVTDSVGGAVFQVALADGAVTPWVQHEELEPLADSCGPAAIRLGANGIVKLGDAFYVANTDRAQIVKIPVTATGAAGTPEIFLGPDCASLFGLDDVRATPDGKLVYAVNYGNRIGLAGPDGKSETLLQGKPLDGPASLEVLSDPLRVVVTNSSFGNFFTGQAASPSLITLTVE
jgi:hypothetical protein